MATTIEVKVPNLGDSKDVPVSELLVAVGDTVNQDQSLVRLQAGQDIVEVSSPASGVIKSFKVAVGDHVSEGAAIALLEAAATSG